MPHTPEQKRLYRASPEGVAAARKYSQSPAGRASQARYRKTARGAYMHQRKRAKQRGIDFQLTFAEFLAIWDGRLPQRGKGSDQLCMARCGDTGPYAVGNVKIITAAENLRERRAHP